VSSVPSASDDGPVPPRGAPIAGIVAVACAIALIVLAWLVRGGPLPIDLAIRDGLNVGGPVPPPLAALNMVGGALPWDAGVAVLVAALWLSRRRAEAAWILGGVLAAEALATTIKLVVDRPRPPGISVVDLVTQASFPSGHVTRAAVTGALLVLFWFAGPRTRIAAAVLAVAIAGLMGLARIVAGEHWPTDVLGAYLVAGLVTAGVAAIRAQLNRSPGPARRQRPERVGQDAARPPGVPSRRPEAPAESRQGSARPPGPAMGGGR
jgi:membrane-associated phospholipid phosphatase